MRISRRDKYLLVLLGVIALFAAYYFFLMVPQEKKIDALETELASKEALKSQIDMKIISERNLDKEIDELKSTILASSSNYFSAITQEDMLATLSMFSEGLPLSLTDMAFTDNASQQEDVVSYQSTVGFVGDYDAILAYINKMRNYDKKIVLKELTLSNTFDDGLKGNMVMEFNALTAIAAFSEPADKLVKSQFNTRDVLLSPFEPYEGFENVEVVSLEEMPVEIVVSEYPDYPEYPMDTTDPVDYETYRPKTQIYGFEDGSNFFVANNADITGLVTRNKTNIAGGYSAELNFDFVTGRDFSEANLVFDLNPIMINKQADYIGLWVYAYEASDHAIGAVIIDSKGKEYRIELTPDVNWTQWQEVEVEMPVEITYPCMVQRIYVEGIGYDQKLTGKYLFDQLQVSYPIQ